MVKAFNRTMSGRVQVRWQHPTRMTDRHFDPSPTRLQAISVTFRRPSGSTHE